MADGLPAWFDRILSAGLERSTLPWPRAWAVVAHAEVRLGVEWGRGVLWRWRLWSHVRTLRDSHRCAVCGLVLPTHSPRARTCCPACRMGLVRARKGRHATPFEALLARADEEFARVDSEVREAERWFERAQRRKVQIPTPDLALYDHLPPLPPRCGRCASGGACTHTAGGLCLYVRFEPRPPRPG